MQPSADAPDDLRQETVPPSAAPPAPSLLDSIQTWDAKLDEILARVEAIERAMFEPVATRQSSAQSASTSGGDAERAWRNAIFGAELAADSRIASQIDELFERVCRGDPTAAALVGQLLVFQGALPERRPQLLKDIGEAYYRAIPNVPDAPNVPDHKDDFEQSLARWLERCCEPAGFQNSIELVRVGQRFDATRHLADGPGGVEITGVFGWVVLRGRDKVYTKAVVSAG